MARRSKKLKDTDLSALLSDHIVGEEIRGQMVYSKYLQPRESNSPRKKGSKSRFKDAAQWATKQLKKPGMKELYSKGINDKLSHAHIVASTDYLNAPKIHRIGLKKFTGAIGDKIHIKATDDFQVTSVEVTIKDKNGKTLEKGPAVQYKRKPFMWTYTLTMANPDIIGTLIEVEAMDRPGNSVVKTETIGEAKVKGPRSKV